MHLAGLGRVVHGVDHGVARRGEGPELPVPGHQDLHLRVAFKATSSIAAPIASVDAAGDDAVSVVKGRHDACVALRAGPICGC